jgi:hypothetical protein
MRIIKIIFLTIVTLLMLFLIVFGLFMVWKGTSSAFDYIFEIHPDLCVYIGAIFVGIIMIHIGKTTIKMLFCE